MSSVEAFVFREAKPADYYDVALVMARANAQRDGESVPSTLDDNNSLDDVLLRINRASAWTYVAACGEKVVGFTLCHAVMDPESLSPDTEHLSLLMVDPDYWGMRVASQLLDLTVEHARDLNRLRVTLWTQSSNARARAFYAHKRFIYGSIKRPSAAGWQVQYQLDL